MARYLEMAPLRNRALVMAALVLVSLIAAIYTVAGVGMEMSAVSMTFGNLDEMDSMDLKSMNVTQVAGDWSLLKFAMMFLMWWLMMTAMMLPSVTPTVLLYASVLKGNRLGESNPRPAFAFTGGYLMAWAGFSLAAASAQMVLVASGLISPAMMTLAADPAGALVAIAVGIYQFTPFKNRCLTICRAPAEIIARHHRSGTIGALRLGVLQGSYCLGCCAALMALLFVGGVMNLFWIIGLAAFVALEKLGQLGHLFARIAGALLVAYGVVLFGVQLP